MRIEDQFFFKIFTKKIFFFSIFMGLIFLIVFFLLLKEEKDLQNNFSIKQEKKSLFFEQEKTFNFSFPKKKEEKIEFLDFSNFFNKIFLYRTRPDEKENKNDYFFKLLIREKEKFFLEKEKIYLTAKDKKITFSEKKSNIFVFFILESLQKIRGYIVFNIDGKSLKNSFVFPLSEPDSTNSKAFNALKKAIFIGEDLFLKIYGNDEEKKFAKKQKIFIQNKEIFVEEQDLLIFKNGSWELLSSSFESKQFPICKIKSIDNLGIKVGIWQEDKSFQHIMINRESDDKSLILPNNFGDYLKLRSKNSVVLSLKNKRMILQEKEVIFEKKNKWQKMGLESFKKMKNTDFDFFVFDRIENYCILKGYLFGKRRNKIIEIKKNIKNRFAQRKR